MRFNLFNPRPDDWHAVEDARAIIASAIAEHRPTYVFALYSGGRDSWCSTRIASEHPAFHGAVFINTGTGTAAAVNFIRETGPAFGGTFLELHAPAGHTMADIVMQHGFPGPAQHPRVYVRLKERALDDLVRTYKAKRSDRIMLITGVRESESTRRMGRVEPVTRDGAAVWVAPLISWEERDKVGYLAEHEAPVNPCWETLGRSGECNCGAFAGPGEEAVLREKHPDMNVLLDNWADFARHHGKPSVWGQSPARAWDGDDPQQFSISICDACEFKAIDRELRRRMEAA